MMLIIQKKKNVQLTAFDGIFLLLWAYYDLFYDLFGLRMFKKENLQFFVIVAIMFFNSLVLDGLLMCLL